jgi:hypothetical protein
VEPWGTEGKYRVRDECGVSVGEYTKQYIERMFEEGYWSVVWEDKPKQVETPLPKENTWTDSHYDHSLRIVVTKEDLTCGYKDVRLDAYTVSKVWKIGSKDDSGCLWHMFKCFPRYGEKNSVEREIRALHAQVLCLAKIENVDLFK